jgi:ribosome-associated protein
MDIENLTSRLETLLDEKKAYDVKRLDLRGHCVLTDFFLVATGRSSTHVTALADDVNQFLYQNGITVRGIEGVSLGEWVLVDGGDVVVHLFQAAVRERYGIEKLWSPQSQLLAVRAAAV